MSLFGLFDRRDGNINNPSHPLTSTTLLDWLYGGQQQDSGIVVSETSALKMSAVYRATALLSGLGGALPLHSYVKGTREIRPSAILADPHPDLTAYEFWRLTYVHRLLWGNFYAQKIRNRAGALQWLHPLNPASVWVGKARPIAENLSGKVFEVTQDDGSHVTLTSRDVFHLPGLGYDGISGLSVVKMAAQGIGMAQAAEGYGARLFGSGNLLSGILKTSQRLEQPQAEALQKRWKQKMGGLQSAHEVAVLDSGAEFQSLTMPNDDAQLLESRAFQISEIARFTGVPLFLLMETEKSTSWGTGLEQQAQGFVTFDLHPQWLAPTEQRITKELLPSDRYAKYKVEGLLRGDSTSRAELYTALRNLGVLNADEIRELEDMTPIADGSGQIYLQPMNFVRLGTEPTALTEPDPADDEGTSDASQPDDE